MAKQDYILSIDQGTTSSRAIIFDQSGHIIAQAQEEFPQIYPADGWVEHDANVIWQSVLNVTQSVMESHGYGVVAIGITNQRETTVIWDRETGIPIHNAIVWQDRRTSELCQQLKAQGHEDDIQAKTGLLLDSYFSATKIAWILDHVEAAREQAEKGALAFGTIDSFLIWKLTGGQSHKTDATNASRTSLYNISEGKWDDSLCALFNVPHAILPEVCDCAADYGQTIPELFGRSIPITGVAGDQQAACIGQACFQPGMVKSTYGTGCFVLMNTGDQQLRSNNKLLSTIAYQFDGTPVYALEGSIFIAGAAIQWLRDGVGLLQSAGESQAICEGMTSNDGVYLVPAFTGLGAPYWDADARGAIFGITRDTGPQHFVRAAVESVVYQTEDLLGAFAEDGLACHALRIDGGMVANNWMAQFLSDILDRTVEIPEVAETTALGAAYLAGLQVGLYKSLEDISENWRLDRKFESSMKDETRREALEGWRKAVRRILSDI